MTDTAVQQLAEIRESWGDLLHAIGQPPRAEWPPRQPSEQHLTRDDGGTDTGPQVGRLPLVLRQHPAPANLAALDAALSIETGLFDLADRIAAAVQYSVADPTGPDRWHYAGLRHLDRRSPVATAGSRALGLHWAARWISDRLAQAEPTDLHGVVRGALRIHAETVTDTCTRTLARALGRDGRDTVLDAPCPWCHGELTARTTSGDPTAAVVTCGTGPTCTAPAPYDGEARRTWRGADLCGLYGALSAATRRATA